MLKTKGEGRGSKRVEEDTAKDRYLMIIHADRMEEGVLGCSVFPIKD